MASSPRHVYIKSNMDSGTVHVVRSLGTVEKFTQCKMTKEEKNGSENPVFQKDAGDAELGNRKFSSPNTEEKNVKPANEHQRAQWGNSIEFLMSCIAMSVGLGNIWRFPFEVKENGGGAFLIPYLIVLVLIGRPMYYMEMTLGQFSSKGNIKMFERLSPVFKGIAYAQIIGSVCVGTYYCCLMAITLFYLINSFTSNLPWTECKSEWNDYLQKMNKTCIASNENSLGGEDTVSSSEMWFRLEVLREKDDISDGIGSPDWRLTICLLVSWIITFLISIKGVQSSGKAAYFLALFPYVVLIALLIRAVTLPGAADGIYYFIETDWGRLLNADVWYAAVTQCFFSLDIGFGTIIMYSSYNSFDHNINRDALVVTTLDTCTSLLCGVTIFGILGNLAYEMGVSPDKVVSDGGAALAFISYPEAIAKFEGVPWLFAILFFLMLFILGVGSLVAIQGAVNTVIQDAFPKLAPWKISIGTAVFFFLIGLIYVTPGGQYMLDLADHFGGTFLIFIFVLMEVVAVNWYYGIENFCLDLEFMSKKKVGIYWRLCWGIFIPILLMIIFVYFCATLQPLTYGIYGNEYPIGALVFGWGILIIGLIQMLVWVGYYIYINSDYPGLQKISRTFALDTWRPDNQYRVDNWRKFKEDKLSKLYPRKGNIIKQKVDIFLGR